VLFRCPRCHGVYSVQDGLTGPVQRTFAVECGRCLAVFDAHSSRIYEGARTPAPRRVATPLPMQKPIAMTLPAAAPSANARRPTADEGADVGTLRPAIYGPVAKHNPLTKGGAIALGVLVLAGLATLFMLNRPRIPREALSKGDEARAALLMDDDASLDQAASLFAEAARGAPGSASFEADRAFALLVRGAAKRDLAERLEPLSRSDSSVAAEREAYLRDGAQLVQEGAAAAKAVVERAGEDVAALRAMALGAALTDGNPQSWIERAARKGGGDALVAYARASAELAGGRDGEAQERASAALAAAKRAEPRLLRAQVDAAALALDRRDLAAARTDLQAVLEENPKHERAKRLLSVLSP